MRYAIRRLRRAGLVSAGVVFLISIVISANTLVFTFVDAFLWRNLPVREPQSLVQFFERYPTIRPQTYFEHEFYRRVADESSTLTGIIGQSEFIVPLQKGPEPERIYAHAVTDNFFSGLGVSAALGRVLSPDDDHVAVLSHSAWARRFAHDVTVIDRSVRIGGQSYVIAGVMPAEFSGTNIDASPDVWLPLNAVMRGVGMVTAIAVPGVTDDSRFNTSIHVVNGDYFDAMGIQLLSGRNFDSTNDANRRPTPIIVNEAFIREFFDGKDDAIGRRVGRDVDNQTQFEIIGVANDAHYRSLRELPPPTFYRLFFPMEPAISFVLNVRTSSIRSRSWR